MRPEAAPPEPATSAAERSGREALARLRRFGGDVLVRDMLAIFAEDAPVRLRAARAGVAAGDPAAVRLAAHSLKSSCAQFGAVVAAGLCDGAERAALRGDLAPLPALLEDVERELAAFLRWLEREIGATAADRERAGGGGRA